MWPKILLELLPHFTRLVPVADKYFNSRTERDKAQEAALKALADEVCSGTSRIGEEQSGLRKQLQEQSTQIAELSVDVARARNAAESVEARLGKLERAAAGTARTQWIGVAFLALVAVLLVVVLVKLAGH